MFTERHIQETVARCVSTMVFHHGSERSPRGEELMVAEIQVIAGFVAEMALEPAEVDRRITRPVEAELIARYGAELGSRVFGQFVAAFIAQKLPVAIKR